MSIHAECEFTAALITMYTAINSLNPSFMAEVFATKAAPYNLRGSTNLVLSKTRTNLYGIDAIGT